MRVASILMNDIGKHFSRKESLIEVEDKLLIHYVAKRVSGVVDKVILGAKNEIQAERILAEVPFIDDLAYDPHKNKSIVSGIFSALNNSPNGLALLIGSNKALVNPKVIDFLFSEIDQSDVVLPRYDDGGTDPLLGVYRVKEAKNAAKKTIEKEQSINFFLNKLDKKYVPVERIREIDNDLLSLEKINNPKKFQKIRTRS